METLLFEFGSAMAILLGFCVVADFVVFPILRKVGFSIPKDIIRW